MPRAEIRKHLGDDMFDGTNLVPIHLPTGVELEHVVESVVGHLSDIAHRIAGVSQLESP